MKNSQTLAPLCAAPPPFFFSICFFQLYPCCSEGISLRPSKIARPSPLPDIQLRTQTSFHKPKVRLLPVCLSNFRSFPDSPSRFQTSGYSSCCCVYSSTRNLPLYSISNHKGTHSTNVRIEGLKSSPSEES